MVIFSCRFILDLREAATRAEDSAELTGTTNLDTPGTSSLVFHSPDRHTNTIASSVYGVTVLWTSDDTLGANTLEGIESM